MFDTTTAAEFRRNLSHHKMVVKMRGQRLLITRNNRNMVALVTRKDLEALEVAENRREEMVRLRHQRQLEEWQALREGLL